MESRYPSARSGGPKFRTMHIPIVTHTLANGLRVAGTGVLAHRYGIEAAMGFFHSFSGWIVFLAAFGMLFVTVWAIRRLAPEPISAASPAQVA